MCTCETSSLLRTLREHFSMPDPDALQDADDEERYGTVNFLATGPTNDRWAAHTLWHSAYLASTLLLNLCLQ